jgi:hypothetical protein
VKGAELLLELDDELLLELDDELLLELDDELLELEELLLELDDELLLELDDELLLELDDELLLELDDELLLELEDELLLELEDELLGELLLELEEELLGELLLELDELLLELDEELLELDELLEDGRAVVKVKLLSKLVPLPLVALAVIVCEPAVSPVMVTVTGSPAAVTKTVSSALESTVYLYLVTARLAVVSAGHDSSLTVTLSETYTNPVRDGDVMTIVGAFGLASASAEVVQV